jgi:hypothetical protein
MGIGRLLWMLVISAISYLGVLECLFCLKIQMNFFRTYDNVFLNMSVLMPTVRFSLMFIEFDFNVL